MPGSKNAALTMILIAAIIALIGYFLFRDDFSPPEPAPSEAEAEEQVTTLGGQIIYVEGAVEWRRAGGEWLRAGTGINLSEGDSVETLIGGRVIVSLDDGSMLRLDSESRLTLSSMDPEHMIVSNNSGSVYSRVVQSERVFEVQADDIIYESLGTAYLTHNKEKLKGVEVYHSKVKVKDAENNEIIVDEGKMYFTLHTDEPDSAGKVFDIDKEQAQKDDFIKWNKDEDYIKFKDHLGYLADSDESLVESIALENSGGSQVSWRASSESVSGYKLVWSKTSGPTYPIRDTDQYIYYDDPTVSSGEVYPFDGAGTYYVRVCEYLNGPCGEYSNEVTVELETEETDFSSAKAVPEDEKYEVSNEKKNEPKSGGVTSISATANDSGAVSWIVDGYSAQGYKVVWSKNPGPAYPTRSGDRYEYYSDSSRRSGSVWAFSGDGTYYVRVCEYLGGRCGVYSNQVTVDLAGKTKDVSDSGDVDGQVLGLTITSGSGGNVRWAVNGYSEMGFKVVWSKNPSPTYPTRSGDRYLYYDDPFRVAALVEAFDGPGTYYVRVCEYLGGKCGVYSNEISIEM